MGRRPGSKNKPKNPIPEAVEQPSETIKPKRHRRTKAEMEAYRASLTSRKDTINDIQSSLEDITETFDTSLVNDIILIDSEKSEKEYREWEKQVQSEGFVPTTEETKEDILKGIEKAKEEMKKITKPSKKQPQYPLCDCCQQEIYCSPHRIDTNMLSAQVAEYHRESPRWVNLCSKCAQELSQTVDNWLQAHGCITRMEQRILEKQKEKEEKNG